MSHQYPIFMFLLAFLCQSCMKWDYSDQSYEFDSSSGGLFIICEGNFQYGNATLSFYDPEENTVENEIFFKANGMKLGDVAQSMTIYDDRGWIVVNNSHVIFAIDTDTFKETGRIENLTSPRYIHFVSKDKAYVSQIWDNRIFIVNPQTYSITGYIEVTGMPLSSGSTEQMVQSGKFVFCNCWSYQNRIIKIDSESDQIVGEVTVGLQPNSIVLDKNNNIWTLTDGGLENSPLGYEPPALYCIDSNSLEIKKIFTFNLGDEVSELQINGTGDFIYWINGDIWEMNVDADILPSKPIIYHKDTKYYGLTINPDTEEIYVADAIDYSQQGMVYRYNSDGDLIDSFYVGVTPGAFCWKL